MEVESYQNTRCFSDLLCDTTNIWDVHLIWQIFCQAKATYVNFLEIFSLQDMPDQNWKFPQNHLLSASSDFQEHCVLTITEKNLRNTINWSPNHVQTRKAQNQVSKDESDQNTWYSTGHLFDIWRNSVRQKGNLMIRRRKIWEPQVIKVKIIALEPYVTISTL